MINSVNDSSSIMVFSNLDIEYSICKGIALKSTSDILVVVYQSNPTTN